jgi:hypothetical protein
MIDEDGQKDTALKLGVSPQYVNDIVRRHRRISERVANSLGFMRVNAYMSLPSNTGSRRLGFCPIHNYPLLENGSCFRCSVGSTPSA